jgi:uncharacterized protein
MTSEIRQMVTTAAVCVLVVGVYAALHGGGTAGAAASAPVPTRGALQPFIRLTGTGKAMLRPDRATISFSTDGTGGTLSSAEQAASAAMRRVIDKLHADGVAWIDLRTDDVSGGPWGSPPGTYQASQSLTVTVLDVHRVGRLLADGAAAGATQTGGPQFFVSHRRAGYAAAIRAAIADARAKADAAAAAAGLHITGVVSVSEPGQTPILYGGQPFATAATDALKVPIVPVRRGTQEFDATLTVVFAYA